MTDTDHATLRSQLADFWRSFAATECHGYSPLYERIAMTVAEDDVILDLALQAPMFGRQPNVLLAGVHDLVLRGTDHPLAALYAAGTDRADAGELFCDFVRKHAAELAPILAERHTNTNECGRSAVLVPALRWAAGQVGEPIALLDGGCSAGLNLNLDEYLLDYGAGRTTGPPASPVRIECELRGDAPIEGRAPAIAARIGLDQSPVDLMSDDEVRWLIACVWPDTGRMARTRAALDLARRPDLRREVVQGDLIDDLGDAVDRLPPDLPLCITTTWVVAYVKPRRRPEILPTMAALSRHRPVVWISAEASGVVVDAPPTDTSTSQLSVLAATRFADGRQVDQTVLGWCHPHGSLLIWS
jgi:hypothetical protein